MAMAKTSILNKNEALTLLNNFFEAFQHWCNQPDSPSPADLEKFLSRNFQISSNEKLLCKNLTEYHNRVMQIRKKYAHVDITGPLEEPLLCDNKIVIQYDLNLRTHEGQKNQVYLIAIGTIDNHKFSHWTQATHQKGTENWDKWQ